LLEGLYVLASTKSFRAKDRELIRHSQDHYRIVVRTDESEFALGYSVASGPTEKKITHDGVKRSLVSHVGKIQVTLFEPTDLELVSGVPESRRRYLDYILCQTDRSYLKILQQYRRVLKQRNALLDGYQVEQVKREIFAWDLKLAELAAEVYEHRIRLMSDLNMAIPHLYQDIAGSVEELELIYMPSIEGNYRHDFMDILSRNFARDLAAGFTTIGPHREDFKVRFKNNNIAAVASRGEVRTVVLAMKLAELAYSEARTGIRPILLLDDVFSELDEDRRSFLLDRLHGHQTVITTTNIDAIAREFSTAHSIISIGAAARA
jgi:DNA replication and repair protein RecF